ncbi:MAG: class I SAM-dependent methyltransferase [Anaerolineae bacterium]|nr:class I SAM-dependent methyltransferase [Anaerolineae bacterium]MDW8171550.1 class I SAM-dependent methyltransferase [Anaerolineae bacterium]
MFEPKDDLAYLRDHRRVWAEKPILRRLYHEQFYARLLDARAPGSVNVEIGSGPGFMAEADERVWRTDILCSPYVHLAADAHRLPFGAGQVDNILGLDVLHHFNHPLNVLRELDRVLRAGGRVILVEPYITLFSRFIYTYLHQEVCDLNARPWEDMPVFSQDKAAFEGNAAIPYLLIERGRETLRRVLPHWRLQTLERFSSLTYLLSGGFKPFSLLPGPLYGLLYGLERATQPVWRSWAALRALIVWEKAA